MSDKEAILSMLERLPAETSLREIVQKIQFMVEVKEGLEGIDRGEGIAVESVEKMLVKWTVP
jgi:predicted transcriptional regulator